MPPEPAMIGEILREHFPGLLHKGAPVKLLPSSIRGLLPPLGSQDGNGGEAVAHVKFFTPDSNWTCNRR